MIYRRVFKPIGDRLLAVLALAVSLPLLAAIGMAIRVKMGRPVVFRQRRIGLHETPFEFLKFRTMTNDKDAAGKIRADEQRLTRFGRFLRATSLDELPQLWNVLRGEMSLVGPRPLLPEYLPRYSPFQRRRHAVKPGITGLAQVSGRNSLSWEEKFDLDVRYVDSFGARLDFKILLKTILLVVRREGINDAKGAIMPPFLGTITMDEGRQIE